MSLSTLDRNGRPVNFANGVSTPAQPQHDESQRRKISGLRPLRKFAGIIIKLQNQLPIAKPLLPTSVPGQAPQRVPTAIAAGAKAQFTAQPLPNPLPFAECARWECACTRLAGVTGTAMRDHRITCQYGGPWLSLEALRAAHPSDAVLDKAGVDEGYCGEIHTFYCVRELPASDSGPARIDVYSIEQ